MEDVANAIKCQICNGESTKLWHCPWLRNGPISYRYEVTVLMETGLPDHALVSDLIKNGYWNLPPNRRMAGQCLMQEIALYELPQLPVEDRIVWSLSPDGNWNSKTAWNLIRQTHLKVDYAGIVWNKLNIPSIIAWMALNSGLLTADWVSRFYPNIVTLCGLCMLERSAFHLSESAGKSGQSWEPGINNQERRLPNLIYDFTPSLFPWSPSGLFTGS